MKILAIDPGTNELGLYDGAVSATLSVSRKKMDVTERWAELGQKLVDFVHENGPYDFVIYEEQFSRGNAATRALYGVVGIIGCSAVNSGAGVMAVPQATLRKWLKTFISEDRKPKNREDWKVVMREVVLHLQSFAPVHIDFKTQDEHDAACLYFFFEQKGIKN